MGRRPEHSFYPGSGYCGRRCHHPHIHMIVPGGGISLDGQRWVSSRPAFLLPVRVLAKLFRRLFLTRLIEFTTPARLAFFGHPIRLRDRRAFCATSSPVRNKTLGGLRQAALLRPRGGARLSFALYPPGRHLQPASDCRPSLSKCQNHSIGSHPVPAVADA